MTQDNTMTPAPPRSICVIRLSALGDVCHTVAMVRALQQAWPETAITWIIGKKEAPLVRHLRDIRFIVFDKRHSLSSFVRIRRALHGERFAVLVLAQTSLRANLLSVAVRADRRVGFGATHAKEGHRWFINESVNLPERVHQAEALFSSRPTCSMMSLCVCLMPSARCRCRLRPTPLPSRTNPKPNTRC